MKFSRLLVSFCTLTAISGCAYVIPPEENAPRSNIVIGEPHRPQLNNSTSSGVKSPQSMNAPRSMPSQPMARNDTPMLPPVDEATQAQAQQEMAQMQAPLPAPLPVTPPAASDRHVPAENTQYQMSANDSYPSLMNVPPRPVMSGPDSSKARLNEVQQDLLQERANAAATKDTLSRDAAAEPSLLAPMPGNNPVVPPNDPIVAKPAANITPVGTVIVPPKETIRTIPLTPSTAIVPIAPVPAQQAQITFKPQPLPAPVAQAAPSIMMPATYASSSNVPTFAPPAPMNNASTPAPRALSATPVIATQDLPAPAPSAMRPTVKKGDFDPLAAADAPVVTASTTRPTVKKGDFDPLAAADNAPIAATAATSATANAPAAYASQGYMAPSRYADRRY